MRRRPSFAFQAWMILGLGALAGFGSVLSAQPSFTPPPPAPPKSEVEKKPAAPAPKPQPLEAAPEAQNPTYSAYRINPSRSNRQGKQAKPVQQAQDKVGTTTLERRRTHLILLGTGTPNAEPDRSGAALAIVVDDRAYLVDFGPGVVRRANEAAQRYALPALEPANLEVAFLTHLHSDHTVGLPDLISTPWTLGRDRPLHILGPPGLKKMTDHVLAAWSEDRSMRIGGLEPANTEGWKVEAEEIQTGLIFEDDKVKVTAYAANHGGWAAFMYRFETPDKVIVVSGDTAPTEQVLRACRSCDILVHEVYSDAGFSGREAIWQQYHSHVHTSASELAALANRAKPKLLVLTHQLLWGTTPEELIGEILDDYQGRVAYGRDLDAF